MKHFRVTWTERKEKEVAPSQLVDFLNRLYTNDNRESSPFVQVVCGECKAWIQNPVNVTTMPNPDDLLLQPLGHHFCPICGAKLDEELVK